MAKSSSTSKNGRESTDAPASSGGRSVASGASRVSTGVRVAVAPDPNVSSRASSPARRVSVTVGAPGAVRGTAVAEPGALRSLASQVSESGPRTPVVTPSVPAVPTPVKPTGGVRGGVTPPRGWGGKAPAGGVVGRQRLPAVSQPSWRPKSFSDPKFVGYDATTSDRARPSRSTDKARTDDVRCKERPTDNTPKGGGGGGRRRFVPWC